MSEALPTRPCERMFTLEDLHVRSEGGDGREVEAYAAAWKDKNGRAVRTEIRDQDGHYLEELLSTSFNRTISHRGTDFGVLFNHGRTVDGAPNPAATMPIGVPLEIRTDERGVYTRTRYLNNPLADWVLDAIKQKAIRGQSFSGAFRKSVRSRPADSRIPLITRHEVEMREYGPAVFPAYADAMILGSRAEMFMRTLLATPADKRLDWLQQFELTTPELDPVGSDGTSTLEPAVASADDSQPHSARSTPLAQRIRAERQRRGME